MRPKRARQGLTLLIILILAAALTAGILLVPQNSSTAPVTSGETTSVDAAAFTTASKPIATTTAPPEPLPEASVLRHTIIDRSTAVRSVREYYQISQTLPATHDAEAEEDFENHEGEVLVDYYPESGNQYQLVVDDAGTQIALMVYDDEAYIAVGDDGTFQPYEGEEPFFFAAKYRELVSLIDSDELTYTEPAGDEPVVFSYSGSAAETYDILNSALHLGFDEQVVPEMLQQDITLKFDRYRFDLFEAEIELTATAEHDPFKLAYQFKFTEINNLRELSKPE